eukprot:Skav231284  [mRNA]  locus=scaffold161:131471:137028:+ [translate_table: standard]
MPADVCSFSCEQAREDLDQADAAAAVVPATADDQASFEGIEWAMVGSYMFWTFGEVSAAISQAKADSDQAAIAAATAQAIFEGIEYVEWAMVGSYAGEALAEEATGANVKAYRRKGMIIVRLEKPLLQRQRQAGEALAAEAATGFMLLVLTALRPEEAGFCLLMVQFIRVIRALRPDVYFVVEQPANSWLFKLPEWTELIRELRMVHVTTWMGAFGLSMLKPTRLVSNMPHVTDLAVTMTRELKEKIQRRISKMRKAGEEHAAEAAKANFGKGGIWRDNCNVLLERHLLQRQRQAGEALAAEAATGPPDLHLVDVFSGLARASMLERIAGHGMT